MRRLILPTLALVRLASPAPACQLRRRLLMLMATVGCVFWLGHEGGAAVGSTAATSIPEPAFASLAALGLVGLIALGIYLGLVGLIALYIHGCRADRKKVV